MTLAIFAGSLFYGCDRPAPVAPPPPPEAEPEWDVPAPKKIPTRGQLAVEMTATKGKSLEALGLNDPWVENTRKPWCQEALGTRDAVHLGTADVYMITPAQIGAMKKLIGVLDKAKPLMAPAPLPEKEQNKRAQKLETNRKTLAKQIASMGDKAPMQLHLTYGAVLARLGEEKEALEVLRPMFEKRQAIAAEHGLQALCLFTPEMWPQDPLFWEAWTETALPEISIAAPPPPTTPSWKDLEAAVDAFTPDEAGAKKLGQALRAFIAARHYNDTEPLARWAVLSVLLTIDPKDEALWEWRAVATHRMGYDGAAKADATRACFLGDATACVLVQWLSNETLIAIAGDNKHYWPVEK